jgi:hypothetical protein
MSRPFGKSSGERDSARAVEPGMCAPLETVVRSVSVERLAYRAPALRNLIGRRGAQFCGRAMLAWVLAGRECVTSPASSVSGRLVRRAEGGSCTTPGSASAPGPRVDAVPMAASMILNRTCGWDSRARSFPIGGNVA